MKLLDQFTLLKSLSFFYFIFFSMLFKILFFLRSFWMTLNIKWGKWFISPYLESLHKELLTCFTFGLWNKYKKSSLFPDTLIQGMYPDTLIQGMYPDTLIQGMYPDTLIQGMYPDTLIQGMYPDTLIQGMYPDTLIQGMYPDTLRLDKNVSFTFPSTFHSHCFQKLGEIQMSGPKTLFSLEYDRFLYKNAVHMFRFFWHLCWFWASLESKIRYEGCSADLCMFFFFFQSQFR